MDHIMQNYMFVFDFSPPHTGHDNLLLRVMGADGTMMYRAYNDADAATIQSEDKFPLGQWVHVGVIHCPVDNKGLATMYWDGEEVTSGEVPMPRQVERTRNYIGMGTMTSHLPLKAGSGLHALSFYNDPSVTIEQVRVRSGPE
eukprot:COSAG02_NODE_38384_length_429_cov_1.490909_1_plen_142_part_11